MKLIDLVPEGAVSVQLQSTQRDDVIAEMVDLLIAAGSAEPSARDTLIAKVLSREQTGSTGYGRGVAVPHVKHAGIPQPVAAVGRSEKGIDFVSLDKQPVYSVILLLSPADDADRHLQAMEAIFENLNQDDFRRFLRQSQTVEQIRETIQDADEGAGS